jgi:hypothetical protein
MGLWTVPIWSTVDRWPLPRAQAHQSLAFGSSGGRGCQTRGEEEEGSTGVPIPGPPELIRQRRVGSEGGGGESSGAGSLEALKQGKGERERSGGTSGCWGALL